MVSDSEFRTGLCFSYRFEPVCCRYMWSNSERTNAAVNERLLKTCRDQTGRDPVFHPAESACSDYRFSPESRYRAVLTEFTPERSSAVTIRTGPGIYISRQQSIALGLESTTSSLELVEERHCYSSGSFQAKRLQYLNQNRVIISMISQLH